MTAPDLETIGTALWGPGWMGEMARTLGIAYRKIRRMNKGAAYVPAGVWSELADLLDLERQRLADLADHARHMAIVPEHKEKGRE